MAMGGFQKLRSNVKRRQGRRFILDDKMRKFLDWLFDHGVGLAFAVIIVTSLAIFASGMLLAVALVTWWNRLH